MIVTPEILKLPSDWQAVPASEHLTLESGQRPSQHVTDDPNDVPSWGGENITDDGFITLENQRFINREYFRTKGKGKVRVGDILVNKDGANTGKVAFVDSLPVAEVSVNEHVFIVRNKGEFDQRFLFDFLRSYLGQKQIKALIIGSAQPGLNTRFTKHVLLPKTDIDEQRRIGRLFVEIDSAITAARQSITTTEGLQKGLMQRLLTGRLKPDGTRRLASEFWTHPKAGLVSKGWEVSPLKRLAEIQRGKFSHRPRNEPRFFGGPYPFIQTADIVASRGYIRQHSQILSEEGRVISRMFPRGTIMITIAANIGDTAILAYDMFATDSVIGITPKDGVDSEFLELCLRMRKRFLERMSTESAQANINYSNLRPLLIAHPVTEDEQKAVAAPIIDCEKLILAKEQKISALQRLKKSLMQNLLTGRVRLLINGAAEAKQ